MKHEPLDEIARRQATKPIENYLKKSLDERRFLARQRVIANAINAPKVELQTSRKNSTGRSKRDLTSKDLDTNMIMFTEEN